MGKAYIAQPGSRVTVHLANSSGVDQGPLANAGSQVATFDTMPVAPKGAQRVGLYVSVSAVTGSSPTFDIDLEQSFDKAASWAEMPQSADVETVAELTQITATGNVFRWFEFIGDVEFARIRGEFTLGGSSTPGMTFDQAWWIFDYGQRG
jgi:hypothetical protein